MLLQTTDAHEQEPWTDLAPEIFRQRLVVEGVPAAPLDRQQVSDYLRALGEVTDMVVLADPVTHRSDRYGWAGWVHWETSGAHLYAWDTPRLFFSVDVYTCKPFEPQAVIDFTAEVFAASSITARTV